MLENMGLVRRSERSWMSGFFAGAGFGAVAGIAAAALLTPTDGKEMRKLVRSKAKRLAKGAEKQMAALKSVSTNGARDQVHA
jgi:gas vesicle protein